MARAKKTKKKKVAAKTKKTSRKARTRKTKRVQRQPSLFSSAPTKTTTAAKEWLAAIQTEKSKNLERIEVRGACIHNLKKVDALIPRKTLSVLTGPSGSGKSSLAFDTIYAEGQRRYVESLSVYARQFLDQMAKPEVESISGLSPTISIEQKTSSYNPRSTVGTVTEIYDYLRLLFARIAKPYCYQCKRPIDSQSQQQIVDSILAESEGRKLAILAPIVRGRKGHYQAELNQLRHQGFVRVRIDGEIRDLADEITLDRSKKHDISAYVDRLIIKGDRRSLEPRVADSVELALRLGKGYLLLHLYPSSSTSGNERKNLPIEKEVLFSERFACTHCGISYPEPEPRSFSFNSPAGACSHCDGLGVEPDSLEEETEEEGIHTTEVCKECQGARLRIESLHYRLDQKNIFDLCELSLSRLHQFLSELKLTERQHLIANRVIKETKERLEFLNRVGVQYLNLGRSASSLSGGESQRIRLATQIGSSLVGVIYVLDEPSIGLHPRDNQRLLDTLKRLRDLGNTVLVVEHDEETMACADHILDLGPGAGTHGGKIVASGTYADISRSKPSLTGKYLRGELAIEVPRRRRLMQSTHSLKLRKAKMNNLKEVTVRIPLGLFTCVTGVSGSGKSSLIIDTLYPLLYEHFYEWQAGDLKIEGCDGIERVDKVIEIDQSPIGRTPRSNPATYVGLFGMIRELFSRLPESQVRGFSPGRFSFNVKGGRCEACEGDGVTKIEMHFLPNVYVKCDVCQGSRYNRETLQILYKGKSIADVLRMTVEEATEFFDAVPSIKKKLQTLNDVGLGYVQLGQSATTLSGGEAQRVKLSKELSRASTGKTVYILDEPSTGLHFDDVRKLILILQRLVDQGNTVIVVEHNLDIIKVADHLIDLGPEGGEAGGRVVAQGTPEEVARATASHTGKFLKKVLQPGNARSSQLH